MTSTPCSIPTGPAFPSTLDLRGIRYFFPEGDNAGAGGGGGAAPAADPAAGGAGQNVAAPAAGQQAPAGGADPVLAAAQQRAAAAAAATAGAAEQIPLDQWPEAMRNEYVKVRTEAAENRRKATAAEAEKAAAEQKATAAEQREAEIRKALGIDETPTDPAALAQQVTQTQTQAQTAAAERDEARREAALLRHAVKVGVNGDRLLDSVSFRAKLSATDVNDSAALDALLTEAKTADPSIVLTPPPASSSGGSTHTGGAPVTGRKSLGDAVASGIAGQRPNQRPVRT